MIFDAVKTKAAYQDFLLRSMLEQAYESNKPMGKIAQSEVSDTAVGWLLGLHDEVAPVLPKALDWLARALASDQFVGSDRSYDRFRLNWARALGLWMHDGVIPVNAWLAARDCIQAAVAAGGSFSEKSIPTDRLDDELAACYFATRYEEGIEEFEKYWGKKPVSLKKVLTPREFGYVLCLHKARGEFEAGELLEAGRKVLRANLQERWLGAGQATRAATWLAAVYSLHEPPLTPLETILRAYDDMPNVTRPEPA